MSDYFCWLCKVYSYSSSGSMLNAGFPNLDLAPRDSSVSIFSLIISMLCNHVSEERENKALQIYAPAYIGHFGKKQNK